MLVKLIFIKPLSVDGLLTLRKNVLIWGSLHRQQSETEMPAGVPWPQYVAFFTAAMLSMMAGAQLVHVYYRPLEDIEKFIDQEMQKHKPPEQSSDPKSPVKS